MSESIDGFAVQAHYFDKDGKDITDKKALVFPMPIAAEQEFLLLMNQLHDKYNKTVQPGSQPKI